MAKRTPESKLHEVLEELEKRKIDVKYKTSAKNVPLLVVNLHAFQHRHSICYFKRTDKFRVFYPYGVYQADQTKVDHSHVEDVVAYIASLTISNTINRQRQAHVR